MNHTLFELLFVQLVEISLRQSIPEDPEILQPDQELAFYRIERVGYQAGLRLADRLIIGHRLFTDQLDIFKYICKEYWTALFHKQIDNLKTNHKVFALIKLQFFRANFFILIIRVYLCCKIRISRGLHSLHLTYRCMTRPRWQFW
jgi:hypothetical protein